MDIPGHQSGPFGLDWVTLYSTKEAVHCEKTIAIPYGMF
jgi:hypothetical protein